MTKLRCGKNRDYCLDVSDIFASIKMKSPMPCIPQDL